MMDQQEVIMIAKDIVAKASRGGSRMVFEDKRDYWEDYYEVPASLINALKEQLKGFAT